MKAFLTVVIAKADEVISLYLAWQWMKPGVQEKGSVTLLH
jgi:hypothetical protein